MGGCSEKRRGNLSWSMPIDLYAAEAQPLLVAVCSKFKHCPSALMSRGKHYSHLTSPRGERRRQRTR